MRKKLQELLTQYGPIAAVTWFAIFFLFLGGWALALQLGFETDGIARKATEYGFKTDGLVATAGVWALAYGLTKLTQPIRIALWLLLTPLLSRLWVRLRGAPPPPPAAP